MSSPNLPLAIANAVPLSPVATQTANYVAGTNQLIPVDSSTIPVIVTLPNAPADKTRVIVKKIDASANNVGVQTSGSDVFNKSGGSTTVTLSLQNQSVSLQYANPAGIWYVTSSDLPLSVLDGRYSTAANVTAAIQAQATSDMATSAALGKQIRGGITARRELTRQGLTVGTHPTPPAVVISQGNQSFNATYVPANDSRIQYRGARVNFVTASAAISPVPGDLQTPYFAQPQITSANGDTPNYRAEILTDSTLVALCYLGTSAPKWRLFVDGLLVTYSAAITGATITGSGTPGSPANSILQATTANYYGDGKTHWIQLTFPTQITRRVTLELGTGTQFGGVLLRTGMTLYPGFTDTVKAMFVGDSVTAGTGADYSGTGYAAVACRILGWTLWQMGAGGTGYLATGAGGVTFQGRLSPDVYPANPDVIVLAGGINDASNSAAAIGAAVTATLAALATNLPATPVVVLGAYQPTSSPGAGLVAANTAILQAAAAAPNVIKTVDMTGWIQGTGHVGATTGAPADHLVSSDGTHPTQLGHEWIGSLVARELANIGW